ncbi:hypothetical protein DID88_004535 [Monilinia fructigena]|uniref:Uncharacterized protein n=1 Tax=Monilinia fructigena TaxID=38457 RepID=A0A395IQY6_9HELO|nr:hypothetical protein DID88_004535 [Monilinia fructigena]
MGQGYGQNPRRPPPTSQGGYKAFSPSPMNSNSILPPDQREQNGGFDFGTLSPAQVGRLPEPIARAATSGPMRSNGNRNENYGDEKMGSIQAPRRAATEVGGFNASGRPQQNQGHQRYGSGSGSGSGTMGRLQVRSLLGEEFDMMWSLIQDEDILKILGNLKLEYEDLVVYPGVDIPDELSSI